LRAPALGAVLDLDSTVFERYGRQQGSLKGYNPRKHGRPSHHLHIFASTTPRTLPAASHKQ
jgi:hypothetical protein